MAQLHAERFIKEIVKNNEFRKSLYKYESSAEVMAAIEAEGFPFKLYQFEESINHLKSESPSEEQAIMLDELLLWWNMLMYDGTVTAGETPSCTPVQCASCSSCG